MMDLWFLTAYWLMGVLIISACREAGLKWADNLFGMFWDEKINIVIKWMWPLTLLVLAVMLGVGVVVGKILEKGERGFREDR